MRIEVKNGGFKAAGVLRNYVGLRLMSKLDIHVWQVHVVTVQLADVYACGGGIDKRCRMRAVLVPSGEIRVEGRDPDPFAAIDQAAERLARGLGRALARGQTTKPSPAEVPGQGGRGRPPVPAVEVRPWGAAPSAGATCQ